MCDNQGCNVPANVIDLDFGNKLCYDCMNKEIEEEGSITEDYADL